MKFIVIEGLDGAGKSTQIKLLKNYFSSLGYRSEYLHFPRTDAPYFGQLIARFLRGEFGSINDVDPYLVAMLYAGDRKDAAGKISGWLAKGNMVILDRYTYSNIAYQCAKLSDKIERADLMKWIYNLEFVHFAIPRPDLSIFLDVPFSFTEKKLSLERRGTDRSYLNGSADIHESSLDFQKKVREVYLDVARTDKKLSVVNCGSKDGSMLPQADIFSLIINELRSEKII
jgi:dTMP kinase